MQHIMVNSPLLKPPLPVPYAPHHPPPLPPKSLNLNVATLNTRRLWLRDHSTHDGFHMLANLLTDENVDVLCVQEVRVGDFLSLPPNQPFVYDGPVGCRGREAGLLVRGGVTRLTLPGVEDVLLMRWRVFENSVCICTFYARHAGLPEGERGACWQDLLQVARHVRAMSDLPMMLAGDANVWHHFASRGGADETRFERVDGSWGRRENVQLSNKGRRSWTASATP